MKRTFIVILAITLLVACGAGGFRGLSTGSGKCIGSGCTVFG